MMEPATGTMHETILAELEETRAAFHALLASLGDEDWKRKSANPAWSIGELLYHIAVSQRFIEPEVKRIQQNRMLPPFAPSLYNWLQVFYVRWGAHRHNRRSVGQLYDAEHPRVLAALGAVRDDEWQRGATYPDIDPPLLTGFIAIEMMFRYQKHHFEAHAADIRQSLFK